MYCVVDASIAAAWVAQDEKGKVTDAILDVVEREGAFVPDLFWHEIRNILLKLERRGRSKPGDAEVAMGRLRDLSLTVSACSEDRIVLEIARAHNLSAYDASYLDVAIRSAHPLATADRRLTAGAKACGVVVLGPYAGPTP